jgi:hypothetical protein
VREAAAPKPAKPPASSEPAPAAAPPPVVAVAPLPPAQRGPGQPAPAQPAPPPAAKAPEPSKAVVAAEPPAPPLPTPKPEFVPEPPATPRATASAPEPAPRPVAKAPEPAPKPAPAPRAQTQTAARPPEPPAAPQEEPQPAPAHETASRSLGPIPLRPGSSIPRGGPPLDATDLPPIEGSGPRTADTPRQEASRRWEAPRTTSGVGASTPTAAGSSPECRPYVADTTITGAAKPVSGLACRQPDGRWKLVTERPMQ